MSSLRSSSSSRSKAEHVGRASDVSLSSRQTQWAPEVAVEDHHVSRSQLPRRRSRQPEENSPLSPEWSGAPSSLVKMRRPSFVPPLHENFQRARKPRVEPDASPETAKTGPSGQPVSPEEGKSLRSSWEINVKDLVGDAVGNVRVQLHVLNRR